jgi:hypothetical protein
MELEKLHWLTKPPPIASGFIPGAEPKQALL